MKEVLGSHKLPAEGDENQSLSAPDARALVRLLGDVAVLEGGTIAKRRFLMRGLMKMTKTYWWGWAHLTGLRGPDGFSMFTYEREEFPSLHAEEAIIKGSYDQENPFPEFFAARQLPFRHQTFLRQDLVADAAVYASPTNELYRKPAGFDHSLMSVYPLAPPDAWSLMIFHRKLGMPAYTARDRFIVHLVTSAIDWLHRAELKMESRSRGADLTPRQRQVVMFLLEGRSPKQIGKHLDISIHTVREHIKHIYEQFDCSDRGEFFAKFRSGGQSAA